MWLATARTIRTLHDTAAQYSLYHTMYVSICSSCSSKSEKHNFYTVESKAYVSWLLQVTRWPIRAGVVAWRLMDQHNGAYSLIWHEWSCRALKLVDCVNTFCIYYVCRVIFYVFSRISCALVVRSVRRTLPMQPYAPSLLDYDGAYGRFLSHFSPCDAYLLHYMCNFIYIFHYCRLVSSYLTVTLTFRWVISPF